MTVSEPCAFDLNRSSTGMLTNSSQFTADLNVENPFMEIKILKHRLTEVEQEKFTTEQRLHLMQKDLNSSKEIIAELRIALTNIKRHDITQYELDMRRLAEKLIVETELRGEVEHAKFELENELEELSIKLFQEANKMVVEQRKVCAEIKRRNTILERQLEEYRELSSLQSEQLVELKWNLMKSKSASPYNALSTLIIPLEKKPTNGELFGNPLPSPKSSIYTNLSGDSGSLLSELDKQSDGSCIWSEDSSICRNKLSFNSDDIRYIEFKEFLEQPPKNLLHSRFVKRCITEDIDILLRFDSTTVGVRSWFQQRRLLAAVQAGTITIEPVFIPDEQKEEPLPSSVECTLCSHRISTLASYTYRLEELDSEPKTTCCFCRERLVSVCDFYGFLRMVSSGMMKSTQEKLYNECLRIRLKMFLARIGSQICCGEEEEPTKYGFPSPNSLDSTSY